MGKPICCEGLRLALPSFRKDLGVATLMNTKTMATRNVVTLLLNNPDKGPGQKKARQAVVNFCPFCATPLTDEAAQ